MKPASDSTAIGQAPAKEKEEFVSRQLIRPTLRKVEAQAAAAVAPATEAAGPAEVGERPTKRPERVARPPKSLKSGAGLPEQTHAEDFYYQKQMTAKTLMSVFLKNGEVVQGVIEWYDRNCIKLSRAGKPNLLLYKPGIRYMHKSDETR
jgi:RNA chaperone Hfq